MIEKRNFEVITFLRGFSILAVVLFHYLSVIEISSPYDKIIYGGGTGVHLFILLSGLGLNYSQLSKPLNYCIFLKKRLTNIFIPYFLIVTISAFISFLIPIYKNSLYAFGGHILLYKMFDNNITGSYGYQLWFISMIIQFYVTFIIIVKIKNKLSNSLIFFIIFLFISIIWAIVVYKIGKSTVRIWNSFFLQYIWEFTLGMLIADNIDSIKNTCNKFHNNRPIVFKISFLILGVFFIAIYGFLAIKAGSFGRLFNDIPALIGFSSLAIFIYILNINFIKKFLIFTGFISFPLYLSHILILNIFKYFFSSSFLIICLSLLISYVFSYYFNIIVNKMKLNMMNKLIVLR